METSIKKAFTLAEALVVMIILAIIASVCVFQLKPKEIKADTLKKLGAETYNELSNAMATTRAKYSKIGSLDRLKTKDGTEFSIKDSNAASNFVPIFLTTLKVEGESSAISYDSYSNGQILKNGVFIAFKFYGNCSSDTITYNSFYGSDTIAEYDTCGAIFYDVNQADPPNAFGVDRYIVAFDKDGLR